MPLLEPAGRPSATEAAKRGLSSLLQLSVRHWAPFWGLLHVLSYHGGWWAAFQLGWRVPWCAPDLGLGLIALLPAALALGRSPARVIAVWSLVALAGLFGGAGARGQVLARPAWQGSSTHGLTVFRRWEGASLLRITSWPESGPGATWKCAALLVAMEPAAGEGPRRGDGIYLRGSGRLPRPGDLVSGRFLYTLPQSGDLPGMFDERVFLGGRGLTWKARQLTEGDPRIHPPIWRGPRRTLARLRENLVERLQRIMPAAEGQLAAAILLGRRTGASRQAAAPFAALGLAHLFAVSGLHVGVLLALIMIPARGLGLGPGQRFLLLAAILPPYALLTGLPGSVVRAAGLVLLAALAGPLGRRARPLHLLGVLFWAGLLWRPSQVQDTGVLLSYGAVMGILLWPRVRGEGLAIGMDRLKPVGEALQISLSAQWGTLPVVAASFGRISMLSPVANLVAIPLFAMAVWIIALALLLPAGLAADLAVWAWLILRCLAGAVAWLTERGISGGHGLPSPTPWAIIVWLTTSMITAGVLSRTALGENRFRSALVAILALGIVLVSFSSGPRGLLPADGPQVFQFAVGQGDAALVTFPDGWRAWVDTGENWRRADGRLQGPLDRSLLPWLERYGLRSCDTVVLTHGHGDHTGGAPFLLIENEDLQLVFGGRADEGLDLAQRPRRPVRGQARQVLHHWEDWRLEILYPFEDAPVGLGENDRSLVVALRQGADLRFLWTGDLERRGEKLWLERNPPGPVDVWQAGHHGSDTSGTPALMECLRPRLVVISCGVENRYRHPSHGPYLVGRDTVPVLRTDRDGSLLFRWNEAGEGRWSARRGPWRRLP